jgi:hypothetical protein
MNVGSPEEMTFDKMPFPPIPEAMATEVGNGEKVMTYEFRVDKLVLGETDSQSDSLVFNNITVRLIDSPKAEFMVGLNV